MVGLLAAIVVMLAGGVLAHFATPAFERWLGSTGATSARPPASGPPASAASQGLEPELRAVPAPQNDGVRSPVERGPTQQPNLALPASNRALRSGTFTLRTTNVIGRRGVAFIPPEATSGPRPLLVLFHGTGGSGAQMFATFSQFAKLRGLIVLAPDSGRSPDGAYNWQVPDRSGDTTDDVAHVHACLDELYATPHLSVDPEHVLAAGHSGGGSSAAYLGTTEPRVRAFAVLHGGVFAGGLGTSQARAWFSTGSEDALRPPVVMERAAAATRSHTSEVTTHVYPGGHGLSADELSELIAWWLGR
jgi:poly(3-hydroxybutyrate) depolymerase